MPGKVKVKIVAGRNLPVMDRSSDNTDAYVEIKLGNTTFKTDVCRKSLNPQWNSEWYRFEADDSELQDEPLQIRLMDHDTYSANDAIGKVYLDLNPLLLPVVPGPVKNVWSSDNSTTSSTSLSGGAVMSGWIPVYDTMHGIRGEVNVIVKVELFSDFNKFRQSSCGVQFFCSPVIPYGYHAQVIHGFVEELVVNDDPEYQWIDKIRTPRASNEARQTLFLKLSGELQRKIGLKALDLGGNAVIGYQQCFDLEGESGIVVRGIGTAVTLVRLQEVTLQQPPPPPPLASSITSEDGMDPGTVLNVTVPSLVDCGMLLVQQSLVSTSPHLCVTPPTPHDTIQIPTLPCLQEISPTKLGPNFPGITSQMSLKNKRKRCPVVVIPHYLSSDSKSGILLDERRVSPEGDKGRHFSQPSTNLRHLIGYKKIGRSTQSLRSVVSDDLALKNLLLQEDMRGEGRKGSIISLGLKSIKLFPKTKLSKKFSVFRPKLQSDSSLYDETTSTVSCRSFTPDRPATFARSISQYEGSTKSKVKFWKQHIRSSSDSIAAALIRSLMDSTNTGLDSVAEVKESPGSSPTSPSRTGSVPTGDIAKLSFKKVVPLTRNQIPVSSDSKTRFIPPTLEIFPESYLRLPFSEDGPELQYVDGHLIPNKSPALSSTSDSSSSDDDTSEEFSLDISSKEKTPFRPSPPVNSITNDVINKKYLLGDLNYENTTHKSINLSLDNAPIRQKEIFHTPLQFSDSSKENILIEENVRAKNEFQRTTFVSNEDSVSIITNSNILCSAHNLKNVESTSDGLTNSNILSGNTCESNVDAPRLNPGFTSQLIKSAPIDVLPSQLTNFESEQFVVVYDNDSYMPVDIVSKENIGNVFTKAYNEDLPIFKTPNQQIKYVTDKAFVFPSRHKATSNLNEVPDSSTYKHEHIKFTDKSVFDLDTSILNQSHKQTLSIKSKSEIPIYQHCVSKNLELKLGRNMPMYTAALPGRSSEITALEKTFSKAPIGNNINPMPNIHETNIKCSNSLLKHLTRQQNFEQSSGYNSMKFLPKKDSQTPIISSHVSMTPVCVNLPNSAYNVDVFDVDGCCKPSVGNTDLPQRDKTTFSKNNLNEGFLSLEVNLRSKSAGSLCNSVDKEVPRPPHSSGDLLLLQPHNIEHVPCLPPTSRQQAPVGEEGPTEKLSGSPATATVQVTGAGAKISPSPAKISHVPSSIHRRSSDSDLSITPKGSSRKRNSLTGSDRSSTAGTHFRHTPASVRPPMNQESLDMLEYPFLTFIKFPASFIQHLGGTVSSRSVKLLERITNLEEPETRDAWWTEIRMEVRSHARALGCNVVLGYSEHTSICDDVCVLSASGTAAIINLDADGVTGSGQHHTRATTQHLHSRGELMTTSLDRTEFSDTNSKNTPQKNDHSTATVVNATKPKSSPRESVEAEVSTCSLCHIPYNEASVPFRVTMLKCAICRRGKVPDVLFTTIELPEGIPTTGTGCLLQAYVCRPKPYCKGEMNAKEISDGLPFLEYELHRLLINKLKVKGMNTIFGLRVQVQIGEKMLVGLATGTAVFLTPLPPPPVPKVSAGNSWTDEKKLAEIQKQLLDTVKKNRETYQLKPISEVDLQTNGRFAPSDTEESDDELPDLDLAAGNKDTCVLEIDDAEDVDVVSLLMDPAPPEGFHVVNVETVPGLNEMEIVRNLQMFTQMWRAKIPVGQQASNLSEHFHRLLQAVYFKLRRMVPCALCDLQFSVELPEPDEMQLSVLGMALGLGESQATQNMSFRRKMIHSTSKEAIKKTDDSDMIFNLDDDHNVTETVLSVAPLQSQLGRVRPRSPQRVRIQPIKHQHTPPRERYGVDITPLSYVPGGKIEKYLGNLNFFFIRESTGIRECGGLSGFVHSFVTEVLAIVRAHVTALGGNAMVAYFISECILYHNPHKNQGQCLINVGGDVVHVTYFSEE